MGVIKFPSLEERKIKGHGTGSINSDRRPKIKEHPPPLEDEWGAEQLQESPGKPEEPSAPGRKKRRGKSRRRKRLSAADVIAQSLTPPSGTNSGLGETLSPTQIIARSVNRDSSTKGILQELLTTFFEPIPHPLDPTVIQPEPFSEKDSPLPSDPKTTQSQEAPEPFWQIWLKHREHLYRQALRLMAYNLEEAEDALSHAMLRASQKYDACADTLITPVAWLTTIVHNTCLDHRRSSKYQKQWTAKSSLDKFAEPMATVIAAPDSSPEDNVSMRQTVMKLEHQLLSLPASLREPLLMRVMEEKSYEEIAEHLNMTENTARKRIQRARDRLRHAM